MEKDVVNCKGFLDYKSRRDMTKSEVVDMFSKVANSYDEVYTQFDYSLPRGVAEVVTGVVDPGNREHVSILDVGAGTGLLGEELQRLGFTCIDWLDPAEGMKTVASEKNIYRQFFVEFMDGHEIQAIPTDAYDCLALSGALNEGLIPCAGFIEMIRITKPGGYICFSVSDTFIEDVPEYANHLLPLFDQLENQGKWKNVHVSKLSPGNRIQGYKTRYLCYKVTRS